MKLFKASPWDKRGASPLILHAKSFAEAVAAAETEFERYDTSLRAIKELSVPLTVVGATE